MELPPERHILGVLLLMLVHTLFVEIFVSLHSNRKTSNEIVYYLTCHITHCIIKLLFIIVHCISCHLVVKIYDVRP